MKKEDFLKLLQARLVERGVPEDTAKKETEHVRTYLSESGMEDLEIEVDEMADGIIAMLEDSAKKEEEIPVPIAVNADSESESVSDELSAAIAAMDADHAEQPDENTPPPEQSEEYAETDNTISAIPIVIEVDPEAAPAAEEAGSVIEEADEKESLPAEEPAPEEEICEEPQAQQEEKIEEEPENVHVPPAVIENTEQQKPVQEPAAPPESAQDIDEEDADIEEFIPYDKKKRMKNNEKQQKNDNAWLYVTLLVITIPIAIALILIAFALYLGFWVILALAMIACVALLVVFVTVGAIVSLVGIVYGVVQLITGLVPVGLFEVGLGIIVGAVVMFAGILVYNFAVRFIPFGMKLLAKLFRAGFRGIRSGYQSLKGAVASL